MAKAGFREKSQDLHAGNISVLKERIKSNNLCGVYVFYGEEDYTKNHYFSQMCPTGKDRILNVNSIYEDGFTLSDFMNACSTGAVETADMFSDIESDEQASGRARVLRLVKPNLSVLTKKDEDFFLNTLEDIDQSIVVFWFNSGDSVSFGSGIYKKIAERALVVNFKREPVGSSVLITWILRHFSKAKINADRNSAVYLCSVVGNDMTLLKNEIDKCIDYLKYENRDTLTNADVDYICIKSTEAQVFDVSNFALKGDFVKASRALNVLKEKNEEPIVIMSVISGRISELCMIEICSENGIFMADISKKLGIHEYAVKTGLDIIRLRSDHSSKRRFTSYAAKLCAEYDEKLKTSYYDGFSILSELIYKLSVK